MKVYSKNSKNIKITEDYIIIGDGDIATAVKNTIDHEVVIGSILLVPDIDHISVENAVYTSTNIYTFTKNSTINERGSVADHLSCMCCKVEKWFGLPLSVIEKVYSPIHLVKWKGYEDSVKEFSPDAYNVIYHDFGDETLYYPVGQS